MKTTTIIAALAATLAGCAGRPLGGITPEAAVMRAAALAPAGVGGTFIMTVRATGRQDNRLYLNSEVDYRDQRNLSVEIPAPAEDELGVRLHGAVPATLLGKRIAVRGVARRVRIVFTENGAPTSKYYYQTHVTLEVGSQLTVLR
jgi:hypothetical protein